VENCSYPSSEERIRSHGGMADYNSNPPASRTYEPYLLAHKTVVKQKRGLNASNYMPGVEAKDKFCLY